MTYPQMERRKFRQHPHLQHRLFDPQLYLATLDPLRASGAVEKLATYPWFGAGEIPKYDSGQQNLAEWKANAGPALLRQWTRSVPTDPTAIRLAIAHAVAFQMGLNVQHIILPVPLIDDPHVGLDIAAIWIDTGVEICSEARINKQVFATLAIPDHLLRTSDAVREPFLNSATGLIATRKRLAGAYVVVEQGSEDGYALASKDTCCAILNIVDDLVRGARKQVILNYAGAFGAVAAAAGASIWSSNYYRSLRRMRLLDFDVGVGRAYPRYFSIPLMGDITPDKDLDALAQSDTFKRFRTPSIAAELLNQTLLDKKPLASIPGWEYTIGNLTNAMQHHNESMHRLGIHLDGLDETGKAKFMHRLLKASAKAAELLRTHSPKLTPAKSDFRHQATWLEAFETWMRRAGHLP